MLKTVNSLTKNIAGLRLGCVELFKNHIVSVDGRILLHTHHEYPYFWQISPGTNQKQLSEQIDVKSEPSTNTKFKATNRNSKRYFCFYTNHQPRCPIYLI